MASSVLPEPVVLRLQGRRIAPLLRRDALSWPAVLLPHRSWLLNSPFQLELRGNPENSPYRASLCLRLWPADRHRSDVARLQRQLETQQAPGWPITAAGPIRRIQKPDGPVQAGWRWFPSGELLVVLGSDVPLASQPQTPSAAVLRQGLQLSAAPACHAAIAVAAGGVACALGRSAATRCSVEPAPKPENPLSWRARSLGQWQLLRFTLTLLPLAAFSGHGFFQQFNGLRHLLQIAGVEPHVF